MLNAKVWNDEDFTGSVPHAGWVGCAVRTGAKNGAFLSSLTGLVPLPSTNPPFETVGYGRSSPRDFSGFLEHGANSGISRMGFGIYRIFN